MTTNIFRLFAPILLLLLSFAATAAERTVYFVNDALGSPVAAMDEQGAVLWRESYAPYGERRSKSPDNSGKPAYTGKPEEVAAGLVYMGGRWYDPEIGQFTGIDPQGFKEDNPQSFARYGYANNSPYRYSDPNGESPLDIAFLVYDLGVFAAAVYNGEGVAAAGMDLAIDLVGIASPVPGVGQGIKVARAADKASGAAAVVANKTTKEVLTRKAPGRDGGISEQIIERDASGNVISRTHKVTTGGKTVHQHQNQIGKEGGVRQFPDEWTGAETIKAPYENIPPKFPADKVPGGRY